MQDSWFDLSSCCFPKVPKPELSASSDLCSNYRQISLCWNHKRPLCCAILNITWRIIREVFICWLLYNYSSSERALENPNPMTWCLFFCPEIYLPPLQVFWALQSEGSGCSKWPLLFYNLVMSKKPIGVLPSLLNPGLTFTHQMGSWGSV